MITRLEIQNYKALKDVAIDLTPIHVLIGPNDSGKTSILEALQILSRTLEKYLSDALPDPDKTQPFTFGDASNPIGLTVGISGQPEFPSDITYAAQFTRAGARWTTEDSISVDQKVVRAKPHPNSGESALRQYLKKHENQFRPGSIDDLSLEGIFGKITETLGGIRAYRWIPRYLATPSAPSRDRRLRMEESGFGLPTLLMSLMLENRTEFDDLERDFQRVFPEVESIRLRQEPAFSAQPTGLSDTPKTEGFGIWIKFRNMPEALSAGSISDGFLLILAYLALQYTPEPPPMLLIEEPENGIHPKRLESVVRMLRSLTEREGGPQILLTTHSPYLLDQFKPEEVTLCTKGEDGTVSTMRMSDSKAVQKQRGIFTLGEIWGGEGEDGILGRKKVNRAASE